MALDGAFLYAVRQELSGLIGSRIEKIHQPAREEILISLRNMGGKAPAADGQPRPPPAAADSAEPGKPGPAADVLHAAAETAGKWKTPCNSTGWIGTCTVF